MPGRVSGLAVTAIAGGLIVAFSGIRNATISDTLRSLIQGQAIPESTAGSIEEKRADLAAAIGAGAIGGIEGGIPPSLADLGSRVVADARQYLGRPYVFGAAGPNSFDCSGLVNRVYGVDLHMPLPGAPNGTFSRHGPVSQQWYVWNGLVTIPRSAMQAGDLVCWMGHIAIATGPDSLIEASSGRVHESKMRTVPTPLVRRYRNVALPAATGATGGSSTSGTGPTGSDTGPR